MIGYGKIVFLAGLIDLGQDNDQSWKSHVTMELKKLGFSVINPATTFVVTRPVEDDEYLIELGHKIRRINEYAMANSDYIIARITERMSVGTVTEGRTFKAYYNTDSENYLDDEVEITVVVNKVQAVYGGEEVVVNATYGQTLADVTLPEYFTWANSLTSVGTATSEGRIFVAYYNNDPTNLSDLAVEERYYCSEKFQQMLREAVGDDLNFLHGYRLIDYRGGQSLHSWELGMKGKCSEAEIRFMNSLILNRRKPIFGKEQDGKKLTLEQIKTFYKEPDIDEVISSLLEKRYLQVNDGKYNPVCGNMSFEVFKFLDPESISVTLTSSDANRLGVIQNNRARHITPRECARLQGFPDTFKLHPNDSWSYKQFGNSVSVPVIEAVFNEFIKDNRDSLDW